MFMLMNALRRSPCVKLRVDMESSVACRMRGERPRGDTSQFVPVNSPRTMSTFLPQTSSRTVTRNLLSHLVLVHTRIHLHHVQIGCGLTTDIYHPLSK